MKLGFTGSYLNNRVMCRNKAIESLVQMACESRVRGARENTNYDVPFGREVLLPQSYAWPYIKTIPCELVYVN